MNKILIVDNEKEQAEKIAYFLEENLKEKEVTIFTENFGDVIDYVRKKEPMAVILAINTNGINGLKLGKKIRQFTTKTQFIFISDSNSFEYARKALVLGAVDYILKPIDNKEALLNSIKKAKENYRALKDSLGQKEKKQIAGLSRYIEYNFMYTARFNEDFAEKLAEYKKVLRLGGTGYVLNIEIDSVEDESGFNLRKDDELIYLYLKKLISQYNNCVIGPRVDYRILVYIDTDDKKNSGDNKTAISDIKLAACIIAGFKEELKMDVAIGLGGEKPLQNFYASYEEAVRCLRYRETHNIVRIRDIEKVDISHENYIKLETQMLKGVKFANVKTVDLFAKLLDMLRPLAEERRRDKIMELLVLAGHEARIDEQDEIDFINYGKLFSQYKKVPIDKIEMWAYQNFEYILASISANRQSKKSESIRSAIRYMEEYYMEAITLEEIADYVGVTPQHFSKMFKKEMGINYIEWLTNYRIDIAKELLMEGKRAIKEVCYQVGYSDPNYFSRIFKKVVGVSPKEYTLDEKNSLTN